MGCSPAVRRCCAFADVLVPFLGKANVQSTPAGPNATGIRSCLLRCATAFPSVAGLKSQRGLGHTYAPRLTARRHSVGGRTKKPAHYAHLPRRSLGAGGSAFPTLGDSGTEMAPTGATPAGGPSSWLRHYAETSRKRALPASNACFTNHSPPFYLIRKILPFNAFRMNGLGAPRAARCPAYGELVPLGPSAGPSSVLWASS